LPKFPLRRSTPGNSREFLNGSKTSVAELAIVPSSTFLAG